MKKEIFLFSLSITFFLSSCGLGGDSMKPSQVKISGPLGKYFEVIDREYKVKDGEINVEIKRIKEGLPDPWEEDMELGYSDGYYEPHFSIEVRNGDGDIIVKDETKIIISDDELKAIMALGIDESASIHFDVDEKGGTSFKIGSTFKVNGLSNSQSQVNNDDLSKNDEIPIDDFPKKVLLSGSIDNKYSITMFLERDGESNIIGNYYYDKSGPQNKLKVDGKINRKKIELLEYNGDMIQTGHFVGQYHKGEFSGSFNTPNGRLMPFSLRVTDESLLSQDVESVQIKDMNFGKKSNTNNKVNIGTVDIDEFIDAYERYVNKYISYSQKIANGDMTFLTKYNDLQKEAKIFTSKLENISGIVSSEQLARIGQINKKLQESTMKNYNSTRKRIENMNY